jgi:hypothetical protein
MRVPLATIVLGQLVSVAAGQCPIETLVSPSPTADRFGDRIAMNDRHLLVTDSRDPGGDGVFAYRRDDSGAWVYQGRLETPGSIHDVALDGDVAVVTSSFAAACSGSPAAYFYAFEREGWVRTETACDLMATPYGVELVGDLFMIQNGSSNVLVFSKSDGLWRFSEVLRNPDSPGVSSGFGSAMAIDERSISIGAYFERVPAGPGGAVFVYRRLPGGELGLDQKLVAPDVLRAPGFGNALAVSGDTLVVGGYLSRRTHEDQGAVYVYRLVEGQWELEQELTHANPGENDQFGTAVATDGQRIVASARYADTRFGSAGRVYVFERDGSGAWVQTQDFDHRLPSYGYGTVLGLGGGVAAAGPGTAYVDLVDLTRACCVPDLDGDGALTLFDFLAFQSLFQAGDPRADFDGDGALTFFDLLVFQSDFVDGCD